MLKARKKRRRLSLTSLIDVIFLLLLFFMLTSTFSKFSEVELSASGNGRSAASTTVAPLFIRLAENDVSLNGDFLSFELLTDSLEERVVDREVQAVIISMRDDVTAQRLTDLLVALRSIDALKVTILGAI